MGEALMPDTRFRRRLRVIIPVLSLLVFASFAFAAWSFSNAHREACRSRDRTLDVLADVIAIATTPQPGEHVTAARRQRIATFQHRVFARINQARC